MQHITNQATELLGTGLHYHTITFRPPPESFQQAYDWLMNFAYQCSRPEVVDRLDPAIKAQLQQVIYATPESQAYRLLKADRGLDNIDILSLGDLLAAYFTTLPGYEFMDLLGELDALFDLLIYNFSPIEVPSLS